MIEDASLKQARSELESLNSGLEQRVLERTIELERALNDKNELFREVHHRVRNNLQIISSLVRMKLRQTPSEDVKEGYTDILGRVDAIALVHDALYASGELTRVPISNYLKKLCGSLVQLRGREGKVSIRLEAENADISLDKAVTLGLITTELVTNALKHAFPDGRRGEILVRFRSKNGECTLIVSDNGVGLASKSSDLRSRSGLRLVSSLALKLGAELSEVSEPGTMFHLQFPQS